MTFPKGLLRLEGGPQTLIIPALYYVEAHEKARTAQRRGGRRARQDITPEAKPFAAR